MEVKHYFNSADTVIKFYDAVNCTPLFISVTYPDIRLVVQYIDDIKINIVPVLRFIFTL